MARTDPKTTQDAVVLERTFNAPVDVVWRMWTDPRHFAAWYGPPGAAVTVSEMDVRVGGRRLVRMAVDTPAGPREMWFVGEFREVVANQLLVYTDAMSDEHGSVATPGQTGRPHGHPTTTEVRVELEAIDGATRMVMTHAGIPADSPGAVGWMTAFDKLEALLASET
jgi:uncharacterized protein YndB with AHSA1/START domain